MAYTDYLTYLKAKHQEFADDFPGYSKQAIAYEVGYSLRSIEDYKAQALMEFAEAYKHGALLEYY